MTRAETITYAIDAGFNPMNSEEMDMFVAFAKLIAEKEREACAKVCEELVIQIVGNSALAVDQCAKTIRARGQA